MKIAVVGSRGVNNVDIGKYIDGKCIEIVSGSAKMQNSFSINKRLSKTNIKLPFSNNFCKMLDLAVSLC